MPDQLKSEPTSFTLDNMGRFLCNRLQEAIDSATESLGGRGRRFDVVVIGGGTFGAVVAEHLFVTDKTHSRRILVLEAGPFVLPEHVQNLPSLMVGGEVWGQPWNGNVGFPGLAFCENGSARQRRVFRRTS